jgi:hypothetical protein
MRWPKIWRSALVALAFCALASCYGRQAVEPESQRETELEPALPAYPSAASLRRLDLGPDEAFEYSIDMDSVSVAPGPILLYTLVARSPAGATNVTYEGMRCRPVERKIYALGRSDGTWAPSKSPAWLAINRSMKAQMTLADFYFCPGRRSVLTVDEALRAIRSGRHPDALPQ